jgi:C-terminal processing protease CtpA/Prc
MPSWFFTPFHHDFAALLGAEDGDIIGWSSQAKGASSRVPPFRGPVFILIGTNTFSAAADLAAAAKDHGLAVLVGQESGGLASSYGESYRSTLPHTRLPLNVSFKYFLRPAGYDDGRGVIPDVAVEPAGGMDTADPVLAEVTRRVAADCSR